MAVIGPRSYFSLAAAIRLQKGIVAPESGAEFGHSARGSGAVCGAAARQSLRASASSRRRLTPSRHTPALSYWVTRSMIACQHIRVAMRASGIGAIAHRIAPRAAGQPHDARPHRVGDRDPGETRAACIEDAHDLAVADAALARIGGIDRKRLSPGGLAARADRPGIHLAVQLVLRLA